MKILQVCPTYYPSLGGVEEHVRNISERLAANHEVTVATTDPTGKLPENEIINAVNILRFKSWAPNEAYFYSGDLKKYLKVHSADFNVVHAHNYHAFPALYAAQAKKKSNLFITSHYHGTGHTFLRSLLHKPYKLYAKLIFEKADKIICVSRYERNLINENFKIKELKTEVIPNGIKISEFSGLKRHHNDGKTILYVGRLEKYKGVHNLIIALTRLDDEVTLNIVGNGPFKDHLFKMVAALKLEKRVHFEQDLPRAVLLQKYADSDLFALLSEHESYGLCVAEALAAGTPCIVANTSALSEWIDAQGCYGIDYPIKIDVFVNCVNKVLSTRVSNVNAALLDWNEIVKKLTRLYENAAK